MISDKAHRALLERCIRLEARLLGIVLPECQGSPPEPPAVPPLHQRRIKRDVTAGEIAQMRALRERGVSYYEIGRRVGCSQWVARGHTKDVLIDHASGVFLKEVQ